jgi:hypothetical protein
MFKFNKFNFIFIMNSSSIHFKLFIFCINANHKIKNKNREKILKILII